MWPRHSRADGGSHAVERLLIRAAFVDAKFGLPTVKDILAELEKPGRDPRPSFKTATFADGIEDIKDLKPGMMLEGTVTNVAAFGAFVDIGVHQDGLVHVSQLADKFVKDPHEVVKAGDVVKVRVVEVDVPRKRIGLTMKSDSGEAREQVRERQQDRSPQPQRGKPLPTSAGSSGGSSAFADALKGKFNSSKIKRANAGPVRLSSAFCAPGRLSRTHSAPQRADRAGIGLRSSRRGSAHQSPSRAPARQNGGGGGRCRAFW